MVIAGAELDFPLLFLFSRPGSQFMGQCSPCLGESLLLKYSLDTTSQIYMPGGVSPGCHSYESMLSLSGAGLFSQLLFGHNLTGVPRGVSPG